MNEISKMFTFILLLSSFLHKSQRNTEKGIHLVNSLFSEMGKNQIIRKLIVILLSTGIPSPMLNKLHKLQFADN